MKRLFPNKNKSALYKKLVEKSTTRAEEIKDEKYQEYADAIFKGMENAAENGQFCYRHYLPSPGNSEALDELIDNLREEGFYAFRSFDDWDDETIKIEWRKE